MKLPNHFLAEVPERKITQYLLNSAHPVGGSQAVFFLCFGFTLVEWKRLASAILDHASAHEVAAVEKSRYGIRYIVDGPMTAPDGTRLNIRCAWFIENSSVSPRFVTAHPLPKL